MRTIDIIMAKRFGKGKKGMVIGWPWMLGIAGGGGAETTITGVSPLLLAAALKKPIKSLKQYGLCSQAGTPTPAAPVDIVCNNGRVVAGNCISDIPDGQGTFITPSELTTNRVYKAFPTDLVVGQSYTVTVTGANWLILVQQKKTDDTGSSNVSGWVTTYDFTPGEGYIYGVAMRRSQDNITPADFNGTLTLDTTDGKPWTVGTPEVLTAGGVNLFDKNTMDTGQGYYVNNSGNIVNGYNANRTVWIPCKPNTKYSYWHTGGVGGCRAFAMNKETIDTSDSSEWLKGSPASLGKNVVSTVTTPADAVKLYITAARSNLDPERTFDEQLADLMVVEGEVAEATAYEPYVQPQTVNDVPMLLSVGNYADTQDIISGAVTRKVGIAVLTGEETGWALSDSGTTHRFRGTKPNDCYTPASRAPSVCTHFKYVSTGSAAGGMFIGASQYWYFIPTDQTIDTAEKWTAWLKAQYAQGTPVIVIYPLATETTESVTPQALTTNAGDNTITVIAEVSNIPLSATYIKEVTE